MRPRRLAGFDYRGFHRYFLTFCTNRRREIYVEHATVDPAAREFLRTSSDKGFAVVAYTFMPDHLHGLVEGAREDADFRAFAKLARQRMTITLRPLTGLPVWQDGYYEHVLRPEDAVLDVVAYILQNPVRRGLVAHPRDYPFSGSSVGGIDALIDHVAWRPPRRPERG